VIALCAPKAAAEVRAYLEENRCSICEAERAVLGFDHSQLGSRVAKEWRLPVVMEVAIAKHHTPLEGEFSVLAGLICLAEDLYSEGAVAENDEEAMLEASNAKVMKQLGITLQELRASLPQIREAQNQAYDALGNLAL